MAPRIDTQLAAPENWDDFEKLCADLFALEWGDRNTVRHGRAGQRQNGVDIVGKPAQGGTAGVQCKGKRRWPPTMLTTNEIDTEISKARKFRPKLTELTFATTANDDAKLQAHVRAISERHQRKGLFRINIFGWGELTRRIKSHDTILEKYYGHSGIESVHRKLDEVGTHLAERIEDVASDLRQTVDRTIGTEALNLQVNQALERDLSTRFQNALVRSLFPEVSSTNSFPDLAKEILDRNLVHLSAPLIRKILLRASRMAALRNEIDQAKEFLSHAENLDGEDSVAPARARIEEATGQVEKAIQILRDETDPENRSTLLNILIRHKGPDAGLNWLADEKISAEHLTANGILNLVQAHLQKSETEEVKALLDAISEDKMAQGPFLYFIRAAARIASVLAVPERDLVFKGLSMDVRRVIPITPDGKTISELDGAKADINRLLTACKEYTLPETARIAGSYLIWIDLLHPNHKVNALARLRARIQDPARALPLLQYALAYDPTFDPTEIKTYLTKRETFGGLNSEELRALLVLSLNGSNPIDVANIIGKYRERLEEDFGKTGIGQIEVQALALAGDAASAKTVLDENRKDFDEETVTRLSALVAAAEGSDPVVELKQAYEASGTSDALRALVAELIKREDYRTAGPYSEQLYKLTNDPRDIQFSARAFAHVGDGANFVRIAETYPPALENNDSIVRHYGWQLFRLGRLDDAQTVVGQLRTKGLAARDLNLEVSILLETGEWEKISQPLNAFLEGKDQFSGNELIRAAHLSQALGQGPLMDLIAAAVAKAGEDADVLLGAYTLYVEEGIEEQEDASSYFQKALNLSGPEGPIQRFELKDLLAKQIEWNEHTRKINDGIVRGEIPLTIAARGLRTTIVDLILRNLSRNFLLGDARKRVCLPFFSGRRAPIRFGPVGRIALDITSILLLGWLGVFDKVFELETEVVVPAGAMNELWEGRRRIKQFQKSRLERAKRIQTAIARGRLKIAKAPNPSQELVEELGTSIASLFMAAETNDGVIIRPAPLHKPGSTDQRDADIAPIRNRLSDTHALLELLTEQGALNTSVEKAAKNFFNLQDSGWPNAVKPQITRPLYLDGLAVSYLQSVELLEAVMSTFSEVYIDEQTESEATALIEYAEHVLIVLRTIDEIRLAIRKANAAGKIIFGRRRPAETEEAETDIGDENVAASTLNLLADLHSSGCVAFDDLALNKEQFAQDRTGHRARTITTLDIIEELHAGNLINSDERIQLRFKLRAGGAAMMPMDGAEILHATARNRQSESPEFRSLLESLHLARSSGVPRFPADIPWFAAINVQTKNALMASWSPEIGPAVSARNSSAIFELIPRAPDWLDRWEGTPPHNWSTVISSVTLASLAMPVEIADSDRVVAYQEWLENKVLKNMKVDQPDLYATLIERIRMFIASAHEG